MSRFLVDFVHFLYQFMMKNVFYINGNRQIRQQVILQQLMESNREQLRGFSSTFRSLFSKHSHTDMICSSIFVVFALLQVSALECNGYTVLSDIRSVFKDGTDLISD